MPLPSACLAIINVFCILDLDIGDIIERLLFAVPEGWWKSGDIFVEDCNSWGQRSKQTMTAWYCPFLFQVHSRQQCGVHSKFLSSYRCKAMQSNTSHLCLWVRKLASTLKSNRASTFSLDASSNFHRECNKVNATQNAVCPRNKQGRIIISDSWCCCFECCLHDSCRVNRPHL